jgi:hypothetical protein
MKKLASVASVIFSIFLFIILLSNIVAQAADSTWNIETVDSGISSSIALDLAGHPHISYLGETGLKYASWSGSAMSRQTVDPNVTSGGCSLALDSNGNPHISYYGVDNLKYTSWNGSKWSIQTVEQGVVGTSTSLALDSKGNPHISYNDISNDTYSVLKYATWNNSAWSIQTIGKGDYSSLTLDSSGNPQISYNSMRFLSLTPQITTEDLKYANWNGTNWKIQTLVQNAGSPSLVLDTDDNPHICFSGSLGLEYASWNGTGWSIETAENEAGAYHSLALDSVGNPHISYDGVPGLKYASWNGSNWNIQTVYKYDKSGGMGPINSGSLVLDANGNPHISFTETGLKYAYLASLPPTETGTLIIYAIIIVGAIVVMVLAFLFWQRRKCFKKSTMLNP